MTAKPAGKRARTVGFSPRSAEPTRSVRQSLTVGYGRPATMSATLLRMPV